MFAKIKNGTKKFDISSIRNLCGIVMLMLLPFLCGVSGCNGGGTDTETEQYFEQAWSDFDKNYSYFVHKNVDWDAVKTQYQSQFQQAMTADEFAEKLNEMLQVLHDWHVWVQKPDGEYIGYNGSITTNYTSSPRNRYAPYGYQTLGDGVIYHGIVGENGENIAYIRIETLDTQSFQSITDQEIESIFTTYANADGMIIDIRPNAGGNEEYAEKFASRFTDTTRLFGKVKYRNGANHDDFDAAIEKTLEPSSGTHFNGPVACLIGQRVMSSGEWFTLMMKVCPKVTLIGDHTRGASGGPEVFSLQNGVSYNISRWVAYTYDDFAFEDNGIQPHIAIDPDQSFDGEHDYVLERAIQHINSGGTVPATTSVPVTTTVQATTTISGGGGGTATTTVPSNTTTTASAGTTTSTAATSGAPVITSLTVSPSEGTLATKFTFTCEANDTDGGFIVLYYWSYGDWEDMPDEDTITLLGANIGGVGTQTVSVWAEDDDGLQSNVKSINITVSEGDPIINIK